MHTTPASYASSGDGCANAPESDKFPSQCYAYGALVASSPRDATFIYHDQITPLNALRCFYPHSVGRPRIHLEALGSHYLPRLSHIIRPNSPN